jgi:hypothetical protein
LLLLRLRLQLLLEALLELLLLQLLGLQPLELLLLLCPRHADRQCRDKQRGKRNILDHG